MMMRKMEMAGGSTRSVVSLISSSHKALELTLQRRRKQNKRNRFLDIEAEVDDEDEDDEDADDYADGTPLSFSLLTDRSELIISRRVHR